MCAVEMHWWAVLMVFFSCSVMTFTVMLSTTCTEACCTEMFYADSLSVSFHYIRSCWIVVGGKHRFDPYLCHCIHLNYPVSSLSLSPSVSSSCTQWLWFPGRERPWEEQPASFWRGREGVWHLSLHDWQGDVFRGRARQALYGHVPQPVLWDV